MIAEPWVDGKGPGTLRVPATVHTTGIDSRSEVHLENSVTRAALNEHAANNTKKGTP